MTNITEATLLGVIAIVILFFLSIFGALMGAFVGWLVGWTPLGNWILNFLSTANIHTNMVDLGTAMGFIGSFFRNSSSGCSKE
jgi:hypothetical protein